MKAFVKDRYGSPDVLTCTVCKERSAIPRLQTVRLSDSTLHQCGAGFTIPAWDPTPPGRQRPRRMEVPA